ncbi:MAG: transcriptional regulator [Herbiconiux sp.]|uniref:helix-turn-helix domain-containing protein n=1 Tax=Herbiconiux sp. TaxID=1871186 RepID=UPI0012247D55|nr:helix-turn-helix domain-containing protein [Herbiconiux sp.]TAJ48224.1 MAG: transcriptional regulator [Herbiconiux sp.]
MLISVNDIGSTLRASRRAEKLTQVQVAELAGISDRTLRDLESGDPGVSIGTVVAVATVLGLRIEVVR